MNHRRAGPQGGSRANVRAALLAVVLGSLAVSSSAMASDVFAGRKVYDANCASCHGFDGYPLVIGTPDFTRGEGLMLSEIDLINSIKFGKNLMPGYDNILTDVEILDVLGYSRTLWK